MPTLRTLPTAVANRATREVRTRLVRSKRVPRYAYRHYFIEAEGLHSRVHLQNFYSTMWPHLEETVTARVEIFDAGGRSLGARSYAVPPFGGLFLEIRDILAALRRPDEPEGTVLVDIAPPAAVLADLTSFPLPDQSDLLMGTPFWMAYYDADENYMYVHSISPEMSRFYGVPKPLGRLFIRHETAPAGRWRAGRLLDADGLRELQIVLINHAGSARSTTLGVYAAQTDEAVWERRVDLVPHAVERVRVPADALERFRLESPGGRFRVGMDPMPTSNGKPYLLMRYGDGPLSLHHG